MCCHDDDVLDLPAAAIEALAHYRRLRDQQGWGWGDDELPEFFRLARFSRLGDLTDALAATGGDWPAAIRRVAGDTPAPGLVVLDVDAGGTVTPRVGAPRLACAGRPVTLDVVVDSLVDAELDVAGTPVRVEAGGAAVVTVDVDGPVLRVGALEVAGAVEVRPAASLRVRSSAWSRWSVVDEAGGGWWPEGVPPKHDGAHRPYFHARETVLEVPAGSFTVTCTRGPEYAAVTRRDRGLRRERRPGTGAPRRPGRRGLAVADLHVHLNYCGDHVVAPAQARRDAARRGPRAHEPHRRQPRRPARLRPGAVGEPPSARTCGPGTPWPARPVGVPQRSARARARAGPDAGPPVRYQTGHEGTEHPWDWPPNSRGLRADAGARRVTWPTRTRCSRGSATIPTTPTARSAPHRMVEARELVADVALGLVDGDRAGVVLRRPRALVLYHHLLSCGLRLAATAGTDAFLSFAHGPAPASNPPGWGRVYAHLGDAPVSAEAVSDAVRAGRTVATNGPFLTVTVDGAGPGAVLDAGRGTSSTSARGCGGAGRRSSCSTARTGSWPGGRSTVPTSR